ncbi:hypothetical protein [Endozoicomonas sp.]|uniref:hypothetical protein n=1 Tax=Endozoicomonas sp. TaxID=1892382 RepID=UPI002888176E|nr:hypothetical protein [Endozoicomonas sp.]
MSFLFLQNPWAGWRLLECEKLRDLIKGGKEENFSYVMSFYYEAYSYWNDGQGGNVLATIKAHLPVMKRFLNNQTKPCDKNTVFSKVLKDYCCWLTKNMEYEAAKEVLDVLEGISKEESDASSEPLINYKCAKVDFDFIQCNYRSARKSAESALTRFPNEHYFKFMLFRLNAAEAFSKSEKLTLGQFAELEEYHGHNRYSYELALHYLQVRLTHLTFDLVDNRGFTPNLKAERDSLVVASEKLCEMFSKHHGAWSLRGHIASFETSRDCIKIHAYHEKARGLHKRSIKKGVC